MITKFQLYLRKIGVTQPIQGRVEYFHCLCSNMYFGKLSDIFIDDYLTEDGTRKYLDLTFFSQYFNFSIHNFLIEDKINVATLQTWVDQIDIKVDNYDFKKANDKSLMIVQLYKEFNPTGNYKASQKNCEYLVQILRKYMQPALRKREIKISSVQTFPPKNPPSIF